MHNLSIWEKESFYAPQDIIIIGAGLMGLWSALELKKRKDGLRITIVERNTTPLGASTRNAGFACFGSPTELLHDAETIGTDAMLELVEMRYKGIEKIRTHFTDTQTGFDSCGGYECISQNYPHWNQLPEKIAWLNGLLKEITGDENIFHHANDKLTGLGLQGFDALIENTSEAALHSGKLIASLTKKVRSSGVTILSGMEVVGWEKTSAQINVRTHQQINLATQQLLFCTNAFTNALLPELSIIPARGQVIVTSPIPNLPLKGSFHFDEGFYYWRNLGNRILLGGARNAAFKEEQTTNMAVSETVKLALECFLKQHLHPQYQYTIEHHWSGIMAFTTDKKPLVTEVTDNVFAAVACNGMGVALTPVIAEQAADRLISHF